MIKKLEYGIFQSRTNPHALLNVSSFEAAAALEIFSLNPQKSIMILKIQQSVVNFLIVVVRKFYSISHNRKIFYRKIFEHNLILWIFWLMFMFKS